MPLPDWAEPPEVGFVHGDNYSVLEVVWSHPDGRVMIQRPPAPVVEVVPAVQSEPWGQYVEDAHPKRHRLFGRRARG